MLAAQARRQCVPCTTCASRAAFYSVARVSKIERRVRAEAGPPIQDRLISAAPYFCPLFEGLRYGKFLAIQFPIFKKLLAPIIPAANLYFSIPFASLAVFFAIYLLIVNNQSLDRRVRYNGAQAVLLSIILIVPSLVERLFSPPMGGIGLDLYIVCYNTVFLYIFCSVAYAVGCCVAGSTPRVPLVSNAAEDQIRMR